MNQRNIDYRVLTKKLDKPGEDGKWPRARALAQIQRHPRSKSGRKPGSGKHPSALGPGKDPTYTIPVSEGALARRADDDLDPETLTNPDDRFRLARAKIQEHNLEVLRGRYIEVAVVNARAFHFVRLIRDTLQGWVASAAPQVAAAAKVEEGVVYRAMGKEMRKLLEHLSKLDVGRALSKDAPEPGEAEVEEDEDDGE